LPSVLAVLVFYTSVASFFFVLALYPQRGERLSPLASGVTFTTMALGFLVTSMCMPSISRRLGHQGIAVGALIMVAGLALLRQAVTVVGASGHPLPLVPALLLNGAGMGMAMAPISSTALAGIAPRHAGAAAGVLAATQQMANALGVAIIGFIFYGSLGGASGAGAYQGAFAASLIYFIAVAAGVAALVQFLPRANDPATASHARDAAA
jgi:MFS family permease